VKAHVSKPPNRGSKLLTAVLLVVLIAGGGGAVVFWTDQPKLIEHVAARDKLAIPAAMALRHQGPPPDAKKPLLAALEQGEPGLRAAAARALGAYRSRDLVTDLGRAAISDSDPSVRAAALEGLDVTAESNGATFVKQALLDPNDDVKAAACGAVAGLKLYECIPDLIDMLGSQHIGLRQSAKRALDRFLPADQESFEMSREGWLSWYASLRR
jgi:HEAT repeat protein